MISKKQLQILAKEKIGLYYQEKDYLLSIFLRSLYEETKDVIFKGGTCLKLVYNYSRFSEDLDFNTKLKPDRIQNLIKKILRAYGFLVIEANIEKEEIFPDSYTTRLRFKGPLYTGRHETTNTIRIDIGLRGRVFLKPVWKQVTSIYPDVPNFFVLAMREEEIFAEKIRTFMMRAKARDLFDMWCMVNKNVMLNKKLVNDKLREKKVKMKIKFCSKGEYKRDLGNLVTPLPSYEQVIRDVKLFLIKNFKKKF